MSPPPRCDECDRLCNEGKVVGEGEYEGQVYCTECWDAWLHLPFHYQWTQATPHNLDLWAMAGADVVVCDPASPVHYLRAKVVQPYIQPGRLQISVRAPPSGEEVLHIVQHRHLRRYVWKSTRERAPVEALPEEVGVFSGGPHATSSPPPADWFSEDVSCLQQEVLNGPGVMEVCDLGCSSGRDAVCLAETLDAHVTVVRACKAATEVVEWPCRGGIHRAPPLDVFSLCDLVAVELRGWRRCFHALWGGPSLAHLSPKELRELLQALHFCLKPGGLLGLLLPAAAAMEMGTAHLNGEGGAQDGFCMMLDACGWALRRSRRLSAAWRQATLVSQASFPRVGPLAEAVMACHAQWTHSPGRLAHGASFDHATQPDKFLRFRGTRMVDLPTRAGSDGSGWLGQLLRDALGMARWQSLGDGDEVYGFRRNPSSGGLQPLEVYVLAAGELLPGGLTGPSLTHYHAFWHALEVVCDLPQDVWTHVAAQLPRGAVLVGITALYFRMAWKYGEVSFPAVQRDVGHAVGCLTHAALAVGRRCTLLEGVGHSDLAGLLGIRERGVVAQQPQALLALTALTDSTVDAFALGFALPSELLPIPYENRMVIEGPLPQLLADAHLATWKPPGAYVGGGNGPCRLWAREVAAAMPPSAQCAPWSGAGLRRLLEQRRSYSGFDGTTPLSQAQLAVLLESVMPEAAFMAALRSARPLVPLMLVLVQHVEGLPPGLYALVRAVGQLDWLRERVARRGGGPYLWSPVRLPVPCGGEESLVFYLLEHADVSKCAEACTLTWGATRGAAVVFIMLAEYRRAIEAHGAWVFRRLCWEVGAMGQALYIAAEGVGMHGTGHGAYVGTLAHDVLGIDSVEIQDLYHFTVGLGLPDLRRQLSPYDHLAHYCSLPDRDAVDTTYAYVVEDCVVGKPAVLRVRGRG